MLPTRIKFVYGLGEWGISAASTARTVFWFVFLTSVVGLDAGIAGSVVLIGRLWDSVNDPLIGTFSDRLQSRWGRRRPFLLFGAIPFGFAFFLMFYVPPLSGFWGLTVYYSFAYLLFDTMYTLVNVPYLSLTSELSDDYDERSRLVGWRVATATLASLVAAGTFKLLAENVFAAWFGQTPLASDATALRQGYALTAAIWAVLIALPLLFVFRVIREPERILAVRTGSPLRPWQTFKEVFGNRPFRMAALLNLITFTMSDIILVVIVRYLIDYLRIPTGFDNLLIALTLGVAFAATPLVVRLMHRFDKRTAYIISMGFLAAVLLIGSRAKPGELLPVVIGAVLAGMGFAAMNVIPWAIVADVVEADELKTGERREGLYIGYLVFLRKLASAVAIFAVGQFLSASGYVSSTTGSVYIAQPQSALNAMRFLVTVIPAVALLIAVLIAWRFPLDRRRYEEIRRQLAERRAWQPSD
jgi:GPH family glycoside/pentoside/hexuronide:cation symporter